MRKLQSEPATAEKTPAGYRKAFCLEKPSRFVRWGISGDLILEMKVFASPRGREEGVVGLVHYLNVVIMLENHLVFVIIMSVINIICANVYTEEAYFSVLQGK